MDTEETEAKDKEADELPPLSKKDILFLDVLFSEEVKFNGTEAYCKTHPKASRETARREAHKILTKPDIQKHINARFAEQRMSTDEAVKILSSQARAKINVFYKESLRWTFEPILSQEIVDEREVVDERYTKEIRMRTQYQVRCFVIDMEKVLDPEYSHLIKRISDTPKNGITIELYDGQAANDMVIKVNGGYKNTLALTDNKGGPLIPPRNETADAEYNRSISKLADAIGEILLGSSAETASKLDTAE